MVNGVDMRRTDGLDFVKKELIMLADKCDRCGAEILDVAEIGYMGAKDRDSNDCSPFIEFETVCADCEGRSILDI